MVYPEQIEHILATIRYLESRGNYLAPPNAGGASGAYQFVRSTWNNYGGYEHAYLAPPAIQDARAAGDVMRFLERFDYDVSMIPVMWYYPIAATQTEWMDRVPAPQFGNRLTIREYQTLWLRTFARISGTTIAPRPSGPAISPVVPGAPPLLEIPETGDRPLSFPVLGPSDVILPQCGEPAPVDPVENADDASWIPVTSFADMHGAGRCSAETPGVIVGTKLQPVLAVADGVVTDVRDDPGSDEPISLTLTDTAGTSYVYSGFNDDNPGTDDGAAPAHLRLSALAEVGRTVRAGQVIGFMGDSDLLPAEMSGDRPADAVDDGPVSPHIRISTVDVNGRTIDTFGPIVDALFRQTCQVMIGPWSVPPRFLDAEPLTVATPVGPDAVDSSWEITSTGQVTATGWAAMVNPSDACAFTPDEAFGPGRAGVTDEPPDWLTPIELSTETWVAVAVQEDPDSRETFHR